MMNAISFSISSSASSTSTMEGSIQALDEDFENLKTPRMLVGMRVAIRFFIIFLLVTCLVQYSINN